jgi:D-arabinose 1-dehydrogenase-like Zn-dependent alcohol dehydrogenase
MSAYRAARPQGGDRIAVIGFGGLRHNALQIAKAMGHEVLAITNSPGKVDDAREMGADEVLVVKDPSAELQDMGAVDIILSFSPSMKQNSQSIQGLRPGGRFVTTAASGEPIQADPVSMLFKQASIIGSAHNTPGDITDMLHLLVQGQVKLWLETYPIGDLNRVLTRLEEGKMRHRAVVMQA